MLCCLHAGQHNLGYVTTLKSVLRHGYVTTLNSELRHHKQPLSKPHASSCFSTNECLYFVMLNWHILVLLFQKLADAGSIASDCCCVAPNQIIKRRNHTGICSFRTDTAYRVPSTAAEHSSRDRTDSQIACLFVLHNCWVPDVGGGHGCYCGCLPCCQQDGLSEHQQHGNGDAQQPHDEDCTLPDVPNHCILLCSKCLYTSTS